MSSNVKKPRKRIRRKIEPYEVGYKKPPKHTQFKPGQSGNPKGRPKGSKNTKTLFLETANSLVNVVMPDGKVRKIKKKEALVLQMYKDAIEKNGTTRMKVFETTIKFESEFDPHHTEKEMSQQQHSNPEHDDAILKQLEDIAEQKVLKKMEEDDE